MCVYVCACVKATFLNTPGLLVGANCHNIGYATITSHKSMRIRSKDLCWQNKLSADKSIHSILREYDIGEDVNIQYNHHISLYFVHYIELFYFLVANLKVVIRFPKNLRECQGKQNYKWHILLSLSDYISLAEENTIFN